MKYRLPALIATSSAISLLFGSLHTQGGSESIGDRQFSFTTDERNGIASLPRDGVAARYKAEQRAKEAARERRESDDRDQNGRVSPIEQPNSSAATGNGQQAGTSGGQMRARNGENKDGILKQTGEDGLKRNSQSPGRVSNVPGTSSTSPNGTSNFFGTGGIPVFTDDIEGNAKTGTKGEEVNEPDVRSDPSDR